MSKSDELWNTVVHEGLKNYDTLLGHARVLVLIGAPKSGKTTLIHAFLDKDDEPKPSLPVEYTYIRKTNKHMVKDVCYIWEVDIANIDFINQLIQSERLEKISLLLVIDLSRIHDLWNVCERVAQLKSAGSIESRTDISFGVIGMKYDLFEEMTTEKKVVVCRITKHYATIVDGHLIFCTKQDRTTVKIAKDLFSHLAFTTKFSHQLRFDLNYPIIIPKGGENKSEISYLKQTYETQFGQTPITTKRDDVDPAEDVNYANEVIDKQRTIEKSKKKT